MKTLIKIILIHAVALLLCSTAKSEEFKLSYILGRDKLDYKVKASDQYEALKLGAKFCFDFFVKREKNLTEEKGLDIIDTCANPNSTHAGWND